LKATPTSEFDPGRTLRSLILAELLVPHRPI
jgi:hypothetical protein